MDELEISFKKGVDCIQFNKNIFSEFYRLPRYNDEPKIFHYISRIKNYSDYAAGVSFKKDIALIRVIGESIERYSLGVYDKRKMVLRRFADFKSKALNPKDLITFSQHQILKKGFRNFKINDESLFYWTNGISLFKKEPIFIPSQLVFVPYKLHKKEAIIKDQISTGAAAGISMETAVYRGICEIIERDAFMIHYLNKLHSAKIDLKKIKDKEIIEILHSLDRYNLKLIVLDITTDIPIPVYLALLIDKTGLGPSVSIGLKAGLNFKETFIGAIEESLMTRSWIRDTYIYSNIKIKLSKEIITIADRAFYWFPINRINNLDFWVQSKKYKKIQEMKVLSDKNKYELTLDILKKNKLNIIIIDITPERIRKFGFYVVKAIIPELHPLYLDERYKYLGGNRLYETPLKMGFHKIRKHEDDLNRIPHPFL